MRVVTTNSFLSVSLCFYISEMELAEFKTAVPTVPNFEGSDNAESDSDCADLKSPDGYSVNCLKCTTTLCQLSDIRKYMQSNHLVLKNDFHEKVQLTPHRPTPWSDG